MKKIFTIFIYIFALSFFLFGCETETENAYVDLSPMEAKELIDNTTDLIIIDVSPYYDQGHIPGGQYIIISVMDLWIMLSRPLIRIKLI